MNTEQITKEIKRLKGEICKLEKEVNKPEEETIYVPNGIISDQFYTGIINGKHSLLHDGSGWNVVAFPNVPSSTEKQFKLVSCNRDEFKTGDLAFVYLADGVSFFNQEIRDIANYCVVTEYSLVFWSPYNDGVTVINYELNSDNVWYKVVEA